MASALRPFLVVTAICDASARPAAVTRSHGEAMERALLAAEGREIGGLDLVELPLAPQAFAALRKHLGVPGDTVTVYDVFPLSPDIDDQVRRVAGQFLAAEVLWTLEEQGMLHGVPFTLKLDLPAGWDKDPKQVHAKLMESGALDLDPAAIEQFKAVKTAWDATTVSEPT